MKYDIVVVGAGVSGTYSAWRLKEQHGDKKQIALFEYSNRIGGRLYSETLPGMPHVHAELGGMRYIPKTQPLVSHLIEHLRLPSRPFLMGDPNPPPGQPHAPPVGAANNLFYLRQKHIRLRDLARPGEIPYQVSWNERGKDPDQLQAMVLNYLVANAANLSSLKDWFEVKVFGRELYKFGFWDLLFRVLTNECYAFMKDAGGYDDNVSNANAVSLLPPGEFGPDVKFLTLRDGYDQLPKRLEQEFRAAGGKVEKLRRLASLTKKGDWYRLRFIKMKAEKVINANRAESVRVMDEAPDEEVVQARQVVLAMPRRSLELIDWDGWKEDGVKGMVQSVLMQAAFKLFLAYEYPWWRAQGLYAGRSITDLPIRQIYYFPNEGEQPNADPKNLNSLLMASYNDIDTVPFWKGTENDEPFQGFRSPFIQPGAPVVPLGQFPVTKGMVELAQAQVREVHGQVTLPSPYSAIYHDWTEDPYGAGWHEWKAGVRFDQLIPKIRRPVKGQDVFICGEAYSNNQGWVEGALQTAERMLREHFGLNAPLWLPAGCDVGP